MGRASSPRLPLRKSLSHHRRFRDGARRWLRSTTRWGACCLTSSSAPTEPARCSRASNQRYRPWLAWLHPSSLVAYLAPHLVCPCRETYRQTFRGNLAIGVTANFANSRTQAEAELDEIPGRARHFHQVSLLNWSRLPMGCRWVCRGVFVRRLGMQPLCGWAECDFFFVTAAEAIVVGGACRHPGW